MRLWVQVCHDKEPMDICKSTLCITSPSSTLCSSRTTRLSLLSCFSCFCRSRYLSLCLSLIELDLVDKAQQVHFKKQKLPVIRSHVFKNGSLHCVENDSFQKKVHFIHLLHPPNNCYGDASSLQVPELKLSFHSHSLVKHG